MTGYSARPELYIHIEHEGSLGGHAFRLMDWQERIVFDLFGTIKADMIRQPPPVLSKRVKILSR